VEKNGFLLIGKIIGVHGIQGNLKVYSYAESLSVFEPGSSILAINKQGIETTYTIKWAKPHNRDVLLSLEGIEARDFSEGLRGTRLYISKAKLPELEDGVYYWFDLIGLSVFTTENNYIGSVASIIETGSNDVYVVRDPNKDEDNETLIPALESVVIEIDLSQKMMRVDLPEGL